MNGNNKKKKFKLKIFWQDFLDRIWGIYFYLLSFYIISRVLAYFFKSWQKYFDWKSFDFFIILFTILALFHPIVIKFIKTFLKQLLNLKIKAVNLKFNKIKLPDLTLAKSYLAKSCLLFKWFLGTIKVILTRLYLIIKWFFLAVRIGLKRFGFLAKKNGYKLWQFTTRQLKKINWTKPLIFKIAFIAVAVIYFLFFKEMEIIDFWVLCYAMISILFILDSRFAAGTALLLLVICPFLLILKKDNMAEVVAIYAYYFLIITVITAIRECLREEKAKKKG